MYKNKKVLTFDKPGLSYDVESFLHNYTVAFEKIESDDKFYLLGGLTSLPKNHRFYGTNAKEINIYEARKLIRDHMLISFNGKDYDDYMIKAILDGKSPEEVNELSRLIIHTKIPPFLLDCKPKAIYGGFDIRSVIPSKNISLKQLASEFGLTVEEFIIDFNLKRILTPEELNNLLAYNFIDSNVNKKLFLHPVIYGKFTQHRDMINKYLPGQDWAISNTDADLGVRALTKNGSIKVEIKDKFDWMLNGHYVLDYIPEQWKNELLDYATKIETGVALYKEAIKDPTVKPREAGNEFIKSVPRPQIDPIRIGKFLTYKPSIGGAHTYFTNELGEQVLANCKDVHHRDIQGAYGAVAIMTNLFGEEGTKVYKGFMDDKFKAKKLKSFVEQSRKNKVDKKQIINDMITQFNVDISANADDELIDKSVSAAVNSTKLATNAPTGKADEPGSAIYNPITITENRIMLQILLYIAACFVVENGGTVLSVNTDGLFYLGDESKLAPLFEKWALDWNLGLDYDHIDHYIAKDDNSRILIDDGKVIETTGDVVHQEFDPLKVGNIPRIVDVSIVEYFLRENVPISDIVKEFAKENRVDLFAWTLKANKNHKSVLDLKVTQKVNRILITKSGSKIDHYNYRTDKIGKFTNFPKDVNVTIINKEVPKTLPNDFDIDPYIELVENALDNWK